MRAQTREYFFRRQNPLTYWVRGGLVQEDPRTIRNYLEHLHLDKKERSILEIGTGSGWLTALLLELGARVMRLTKTPTNKQKEICKSTIL